MRWIRLKTAGLRAALFLALTVFAINCFGQSPVKVSEQTALDKYVAAPDPTYKYELVSKAPGKDYTTYVIDMTSQTWRSTSEVNRNVWKHWMTITVPAQVKSTKSLLFISGGSNSSLAPKAADEQFVRVARSTNSVVTELKMIPNEPLTFSDDKKSRTEDEIIAYTWDKYLKTGDEKWPLRLPMTKAAVRAMDTVQSFCAKTANVKVDGFVVAGGSKRGWTTWTTAAVDKRVVAIIPFVIDLLNIEPSFKHHYEAYGYYAPAVGDYEEIGLMQWTGTPQYRALMKIEEPFEYRQRLTMPKFIINATGDQFFVPDSWKFYFNELSGVKYLRYVPNADHSLKGSDALMTLTACYSAVLTGAKLPEFTWARDDDGSIRVKTKDKPTAVKLWQATNPGARDFRLTSIGPKWTSTPLTEVASGEYFGKVTTPGRGWTAYFVEMTYPSGASLAPFKFTTGVYVTPDAMPFRYEAPLPASSNQ